MTPADAALVERLRAQRETVHSGPYHAMTEAADAITRLSADAARVGELEATLDEIRKLKSEPIGTTGFATGPNMLLERARRIARAALKDHSR